MEHVGNRRSRESAIHFAVPLECIARRLYAEGLLLEPKDDRTRPKACIVAIPDADQTPEMISGPTRGSPRESQFARLLWADSGC